ncbi:hypothetical protein EST38_g8201 [Candolleomyces aberdarensis]|uniref:Snurportin-1 n=1 Tax=Candolleomyces aberdarensis TaxID=2316362 RepID=A0A4V1Q379_9AGAR|nr:hypothetical protein EST38_g8201 [Candolleomyces aberdarensis]
MFQERKQAFKLPPVVNREAFVPQEIRRNKALEEQKRRRAQQIESNRQFDLFANLSINDDSDSDEPAEDGDTHVAASGAVGPYVALLKERTADNDMEAESMQSPGPPDQAPGISEVLDVPSAHTEKKRSKKRNKKKSKNNKPSKWADQCMYAELLEMAFDDPYWSANVAPVPVGKRCLVVTHQAAGRGGTVANTTVRSRLLGKSLIPRFPSPLPPLTVLDCILDANWRNNGIVHVLDVVRWKGQDIGDCEASLRFWWRDTRLGELPRNLPPTINFFPRNAKAESTGHSEQTKPPQFPYPTYFLPIPYHTNTSLAVLNTEIIPAARSKRSITVDVPIPNKEPLDCVTAATSMDVELGTGVPSSPTFTFTSTLSPSIVMSPVPVTVEPDGLLLYVAEAGYEPGTSPLSSWVPISGYQSPGDPMPSSNPLAEQPLDLFQTFVQRRIQRQLSNGLPVSAGRDLSMDIESSA